MTCLILESDEWKPIFQVKLIQILKCNGENVKLHFHSLIVSINRKRKRKQPKRESDDNGGEFVVEKS